MSFSSFDRDQSAWKRCRWQYLLINGYTVCSQQFRTGLPGIFPPHSSLGKPGKGGGEVTHKIEAGKRMAIACTLGGARWPHILWLDL
ncbi:MAG: hypothetical protein ACOY15_08300 [Pseudomonadota bacterium]